MKEYYYEVDLTWKSEKKSLVSSHGLEEIDMINSSEFGRGNKSKWTSEHLLTASASSSLMSTFLEEAERANLNITIYKSQSFIKLEKKNDAYVPVEILIRPIIRLSNEREVSKAYTLMEKAEAKCPIINNIKIKVQVHPQFDYLTKSEKVKP